MISMKSLPEDIVIDILARLPVKSILRFKSVSKHWYTLPTNPHFTAAHLRHSSSSNNPLFILRHGSYLSELKTTVFDANFETLPPDLHVPENRLDDYSASIMGSCNGLLCIRFSTNNVMFWNPATRLFRQVPSFNLRSPFTHLTRAVLIGECTGFGFNSQIADYKLVKFAMFYYKDWRSEDQMIWDGLELKALVFSWKNWSWKVLKDAHIPAATYDSQVAANGHLYWIGSKDGMRDFVLEFDLVNDSFRTIEWSDDHRPDAQRKLNRLDMETRITVFKSYLQGLSEDDDDDYELLVITENGEYAEGSVWEKLCSHGCFDGSASYEYDGYWNGLQVIKRLGGYRSYLYFFNPQTNVVRLLDDISINFFGLKNYVESLVPVCGLNIDSNL
ncbi:F-box protein CPR1 [Linum perenne]